MDLGIISPPRYSLFNSSRSGSFKMRAEISVHSPTAIISAVLPPSERGVMSKQATSYSNVVFLKKHKILIDV